MFDNFLNNDASNDVDIVFKDLITIILLSVIVLFVIIMIHINPPTSDVNKVLEQPGRLSVELIWDPKLNVDLDLWVKQGHSSSVGYARKEIGSLNLVRDDLGAVGSDLDINYENIFARKIRPGEYIINAHLYNLNFNKLPVTALVKIRIEMGELTSATTTIVRSFEKKLTFTADGQELTALRFEIDDNGMLIPLSINEEFIGIRNLVQVEQPIQELFTGDYP